MSAPHADRDRSEPADRDADNAPSDRERAYAEALRNPSAVVERLTVTDAYPDGRDSPELLVDWQARACVAVEERRTAALRERVDILKRAFTEQERDTEFQLGERLKAEAEVKRLRGVAVSMLASFVHPTHPGRECLQSGHVPVEKVQEWASVLRGPEPTEDGAP